MKYSKDDILALDRIDKLKLINSVTGIKPANLIGTINSKGQTNLAIFTSVVHLGSDPALLGFIARPRTSEVGHTFKNIQEIKQYTINHIPEAFVENAHYTSAKFKANVSEFEACNLTEEYLEGYNAPFVKESNFKMAMCFKEAIDIKRNNTMLVIGEIEHIILPDTALVASDINLEATNSIGISGLNTYYSLKKIANFPHARVSEVPSFKI